MTSALQSIANALPSLGRAKLLINSSDDVVIVDACRTAICRAKKGGFKDTGPEELLTAVLKATLERSGVDPNLIEDVAVGNVLPPGSGVNVARMAQLASGIPYTAAVHTVNRQCSSGLQAVADIANQIKAGEIDVGIGAGVESMTSDWGSPAFPSKLSDAVMSVPLAQDCMTPMGVTSENVAAQWQISREKQDRFAVESFKRASRAKAEGKFKSEIIPVRTKLVDPKTGDEKEVIISEDDGIREGVTVESLSKLKPSFKKDGTTHAGNASQVSDGAAAVLLMRRSTAQKLGMKIMGKFVISAVVGVPPKVMGIGPAYAIPKVLQKAGLSKDDVDIYEINEAFASQAIMSIEHIGLDYAKVNPNGGAIAMGHPLGCTGARQIADVFPEAARQKKKILCTSMCIGTGMGMAAIFVNEQV